MGTHERCRLCPSRKLPIEGVGVQPSKIMVIGEAPNKQEDKKRDRATGKGTPFTGDGGQELTNLYLRQAGIRRDMCYLTYAVKCMAHEEGGSPSDSLARCCSGHWIDREVRYTQPEVIITLGATAYHTLFPDQGGNLDRQHGIPFVGSRAEWQGWVVPMYSPSAGLRKPEYMLPLMADFQALGRVWRKGEYEKLIPVDQYPDPDYKEVEDWWELEAYLERAGDGPDGIVAQDTETDDGKPYCMSLCTEVGTGRVIKAEHRGLLRRMGRWIAKRRMRVLLHNETFDIPVLTEMGVDLCEDRVVDTMELAYNRQDLPQGLKVLAYRLAGIEMEDYEDLVVPFARVVVQRWFERAERAMVASWPTSWPDERSGIIAPRNPFMDEEELTKTAKRKLYREWLNLEWEPEWDEMARGTGIAAAPGEEYFLDTFLKVLNGRKSPVEGTRRKVSSLLKAWDKVNSEGKQTDPWDRWSGWEDVDRERLIEVSGGRIPGKSLKYVPWDRVVVYSARDADATLRIYGPLWKKAAGMWKQITEGPAR